MKLVKVLGAATNAPEMFIDIPVGSGSSLNWKEGTAVYLNSGVLTKCFGDVEAEFIVAENCSTSNAAHKVKCFKILPNMVFEAKLSAYSSTYIKIGAFVTFYTDGQKVTATAASGRGGSGTVASSTATISSLFCKGAKIVDTCGASATGDKVLVVMGMGV